MDRLPLGALDQSLRQAVLAAKPRLDARHAPGIIFPVVIVAEQVQQTVQREHAQLGAIRVARIACLTARDAGRDHDIAQVELR